MNRNGALAALMAGLVVLFSVAALALHFDLINPPGEKTAGEEEQIISLLDIERVAVVEWDGGEAPAFRLECNGSQEWICPDYPEKELDQEKAERAVAALCQVVSARKISDWEDTSVYGLDPPERHVEITLEDGTSIQYRIGSLNTYTNRYYFQLEGETAIYMVGYSVGESMNCGILDYAR